ncbi:MAG: hypothetical protein Athens101428_657 [Candidatus Berkelbacteria bacterium Athens1014_28]|uniref:TatD DNase family protein n=1 Tax=Candidatus Berkelbacteria bacterium Athens1014_28 TaxID=2017145 RepID=A0A554LL34_9BACT|nr:MAG: hypothetical protein Athens101428_657 [Candidatus Berkelbacteria bacterium Athens1014_28]
MIDLGFEIIDLHAHLRENPQEHLKLARDAGISKVVAMPNTLDCLDLAGLQKWYILLRR